MFPAALSRRVRSPSPCRRRPKRLAHQADQARRALCARRHDRRDRPHGRRISRPAARPEHRGREQAGQGRDGRHVAGRQGGARRLHAADVDDLAACRSRPRSTAALDYDPMADFIHISLASRNPSVLVVNPGFPAKTLARTMSPMPRPIPASSPSRPRARARATTSWARMLEQVIGAALVHVPYRGAGPAMQRHDRRQRAVDVRFAAVGRAAHQGRQGARAGGQRRGAQTQPFPTCRR